MNRPEGGTKQLGGEVDRVPEGLEPDARERDSMAVVLSPTTFASTTPLGSHHRW